MAVKVPAEWSFREFATDRLFDATEKDMRVVAIAPWFRLEKVEKSDGKTDWKTTDEQLGVELSVYIVSDSHDYGTNRDGKAYPKLANQEFHVRIPGKTVDDFKAYKVPTDENWRVSAFTMVDTLRECVRIALVNPSRNPNCVYNGELKRVVCDDVAPVTPKKGE